MLFETLTRFADFVGRRHGLTGVAISSAAMCGAMSQCLFIISFSMAPQVDLPMDARQKTTAPS